MQPLTPNQASVLTERTESIFQEQIDSNHKRTDRMFAWLMMLQWLAGIVAAVWISPTAWEGQYSHTHIHVWAAIFLGGLISGFPVFLALTQPGSVPTRQVIAVGQMLSCGLLIHLTGGRIETHFQYFVALAFLAFYRDWRVLLTASAVAAADHFIRGYFWPESMFGVLFASPWRAMEHTAWIIFEDIVLVLLIRQNLREMLGIAERQAKLEGVNETIERTVAERTVELRSEIAERERVEETLRLLNSAVEQSKESILITDAEIDLPGPKIIFVNPAFTKLTGYTEAEAIGKTPRILQGRNTDRTVIKRLRECLQEGKEFEGETINYRKDGTEFNIEWQIAGLRNAAGKITHFVAIQRDITDRKLAEDRLQQLRKEYQSILNSVSEGVHWIDLDGRIKFENPAAVNMLGYEDTELISKPAHLTMHHTHPDGTVYPVSECPIYATLRDGVVRHVTDEVFWRKNRTSFPVEYTSTPVKDENGYPLGTVVVFTDVTEKKLVEARLFQSQKMETVGKLAGGVAHEFNSLLTAIIGQSQLLLDDLPAEGPLGDSALEIRQAAERAAILTRQLLAYGRKQILQPTILDLNVVLADMINTLQHLMGREVDVLLVPAKGLNAVKIDPGQVEQVIVNIAMNAAEAMPNGGKFTLETSNATLDEDFVRPYPGLKAGDYVVLSMTDTGTGMSDDVKARAFEPFFSTKGAGQGTGLGLATCYGIVKQSEGHINLYSEVARGSTLKIYLPQVEPLIKVSAPRLKTPDLPQGKETILLAEDDASLLKMASTLLRRLGYTVLTAANGVEAMNLGNQRDIGHIDLLLTDVVMPHMSGKELSDRIRAIYPHTKILFTSAFTENAIVHQGILNEGVMLLQKPFTPSGLASKVREILDQSFPLDEMKTEGAVSP